MKNLLFSLALLCCTVTINATDLWTGDHAVAWNNTLSIEASKFADTQVGDQLKLSFYANAADGDVIELKSNGQKLPGTCFHRFYTDQTSYEVYVTADMLAKLQQFGLEVCGNLFNATKVEVNSVGFNVPEGAIWAGYFWCDNWKTMELWKESFDAYSGQRYLIVNISEESFDFGYDLNIISTWEKGAFSNADNTTKKKTQIILDTQLLEGGLTSAISYNDRVMFQGNCQLEGHGFNITSIVLMDEYTDITIGSTGFSTLYYSDRNLTVPAAVSAWTYTMNGESLDTTESYKSGDIIPAGEAVVLYTEAPGNFSFAYSTTDGTKTADNLLHGTDKNQELTTAGVPYILAKGSKGVAFYAAAPEFGHTFTNGAHKAYLEVPTAAEVREFICLPGQSSTTTGIGTAKIASTNNDSFDLSGRRISNATKGLYIVNGKKIVK